MTGKAKPEPTVPNLDLALRAGWWRNFWFGFYVGCYRIGEALVMWPVWLWKSLRSCKP